MRQDLEGNHPKGTPEAGNLDDTQELPRIAPGGEDHGVRELPRLPQEQLPSPPVVKEKSSHSFLIFFLLCGFLAMLFLGFAVAGFIGHQKDEARARAYADQVQLEQHRTLSEEERMLREETERLEKQKREMEAERQAIRENASRLEGKQEQLEKDRSDSSEAGKLFDRVTGREKERQQAAESNAKDRARMQKQEDDIDRSIAQAQAALNEMNSRLETVAQMKRDADAVRAEAEKKLEEHRDVVDRILGYTAKGAETLKQWLLQETSQGSGAK